MQVCVTREMVLIMCPTLLWGWGVVCEGVYMYIRCVDRCVLLVEVCVSVRWYVWCVSVGVCLLICMNMCVHMCIV